MGPTLPAAFGATAFEALILKPLMAAYAAQGTAASAVAPAAVRAAPVSPSAFSLAGTMYGLPALQAAAGQGAGALEGLLAPTAVLPTGVLPAASSQYRTGAGTGVKDLALAAHTAGGGSGSRPATLALRASHGVVKAAPGHYRLQLKLGQVGSQASPSTVCSSG
jgi:hypothetical protein